MPISHPPQQDDAIHNHGVSDDSEDNNASSCACEESSVDGGSFMVGVHPPGGEFCSLFNKYASTVVEQEAHAATRYDVMTMHSEAKHYLLRHTARVVSTLEKRERVHASKISALED